MVQSLNSAVLELRFWLSVLCLRARASWVLLSLVGICLLSSPVTQHLWAWDGFLRGGPDFETGSFLILISCCLLMVLVHSCKLALSRTLAALRWLGLLFGGFPYRVTLPISIDPIRDRFFLRPSLNLPLQI